MMPNIKLDSPKRVNRALKEALNKKINDETERIAAESAIYSILPTFRNYMAEQSKYVTGATANTLSIRRRVSRVRGIITIAVSSPMAPGDDFGGTKLYRAMHGRETGNFPNLNRLTLWAFHKGLVGMSRFEDLDRDEQRLMYIIGEFISIFGTKEENHRPNLINEALAIISSQLNGFFRIKGAQMVQNVFREFTIKLIKD